MLRGLLKKDRDFLRILDSAAAAEILKVTLLLSGAKHSPAELQVHAGIVERKGGNRETHGT